MFLPSLGQHKLQLVCTQAALFLQPSPISRALRALCTAVRCPRAARGRPQPGAQPKCPALGVILMACSEANIPAEPRGNPRMCHCASTQVLLCSTTHPGPTAASPPAQPRSGGRELDASAGTRDERASEHSPRPSMKGKSPSAGSQPRREQPVLAFVSPLVPLPLFQPCAPRMLEAWPDPGELPDPPRAGWKGGSAFAGRAGMCSPGSRPVLPPSFFIHGNSISSHAATGILRDPGCLSSPARGSLPRTQLPRAVPASRLCCQHPSGALRGDTPAQPQLAPGLCHQPHTVGCTESPHLLPTPNILGFIPPPAFPLPFEKGSPGSTSQAHLHPPCPKPSPGKHWSPPSISDQEHKDRRGLSTPSCSPFPFQDCIRF